jgi:hypothetical protein
LHLSEQKGKKPAWSACPLFFEGSETGFPHIGHRLFIAEHYKIEKGLPQDLLI